jgi:hypothetical protein
VELWSDVAMDERTWNTTKRSLLMAHPTVIARLESSNQDITMIAGSYPHSECFDNEIPYFWCHPSKWPNSSIACLIYLTIATVDGHIPWSNPNFSWFNPQLGFYPLVI